MALLYCHTRDPCGFHIEVPFAPYNRAMLDARFLCRQLSCLSVLRQCWHRWQAARHCRPTARPLLTCLLTYLTSCSSFWLFVYRLTSTVSLVASDSMSTVTAKTIDSTCSNSTSTATRRRSVILFRYVFISDDSMPVFMSPVSSWHATKDVCFSNL